MVAAVEAYDGDLEFLFSDLFSMQMGLPPDDAERLIHLRTALAAGRALPHEEHLLGQWLLSLMSGSLNFELGTCVGTSGSRPIAGDDYPISQNHALICSALTSSDAVVSYNYDLVMPVAMLATGRLGRSSFSEGALADVRILGPDAGADSVPFITPHGSFCWFADPNDLTRVGAVVGPRHSAVVAALPEGLGTPSILLPFRAKGIFFELFPAFRVEFERALQAVTTSDEIHVIGKQFVSADQDLATIIERATTERPRRLVLVNPDSSSDEWTEAHARIFNALGDPILFPGIGEYARWLEDSQSDDD